MTVTLSPPMYLQFFDPNNTGAPLVGGKLFTYIAGTSTKQATWTDSTQSTPNANPIILDSNGAANVWLDPTLVYKFVLAPANDTDPPVSALRSVDNISGPVTIATLTLAILGAILYPRTAAEIAAGVVPLNFIYPPLNPWRYGADGTNGAADSTAYTAVNNVLKQLAAITGWQNALANPGYPKTLAELTAPVNPVTPLSYGYQSSAHGYLNVFRFMTAAQIASCLASDGLVDHTTAIQTANDFLEGKAVGAIATLGAITAGAAYTNGAYTNVALTGGAGSGATANITVAGGIVTVCTPVNPGLGYAVGNTLSATAASIGGTGAGFSIPVASLGTGGQVHPGGTLFFPAGLYNITGTLRVGGHVLWKGAEYFGTTLSWASHVFVGPNIILGPDNSGYFGFSGLYTMGSSIESMRISLQPDNLSTVVITTGGSAQQGSHLQDIQIDGWNQRCINLGGVGGPAYFWIKDLDMNGGNTEVGTREGIYNQMGGGFLDLHTISIEGFNNTTHRVAVAIRNNNGEICARNIHTENCATGMFFDTGGTNGVSYVEAWSGNSTCDRLLWIPAGFTGAVTAVAINGRTGDPTHPIAIQNDITGEALVDVMVPLYTYNGTTRDVSKIIGGIVVSAGVSIPYTASMTPDVALGTNFYISANNGTAFTINAPLHPIVGEDITIGIFASAALGVATWNAVFKMAAWVQPANGFNRSITFLFDGAKWYEINRTTVDIPT